MRVDIMGALRFLTVGSTGFWFASGLLLLACIPALWFAYTGSDLGTVERCTRIGSMFLQFSGLAVVAYGLHRTRMQFGKIGWFDRLCIYGRTLKGFFVKPDAISATIEVTTGIDTAEMFGYPTVNVVADASIEERVEALEFNLKTSITRINQQESHISEKARLAAEALSTERRTRHDEHAALRMQLEEFSTGGLDLEWTGLAWLLAGTIFGNLSPEIARILT